MNFSKKSNSSNSQLSIPDYTNHPYWTILGLFIPKNEFRAKKKFRLSRGVAVGFWTKFEAQLPQPC
jgi:hypothetical protein